MKLGIVGSRGFDNFDLLEQKVNALREDFPICTIVSGGAIGADKQAEIYADKYGLFKIILKADWERYGKSAGFIRNKDIWTECSIIIAFWDGKSKGTKHTIDNYKGMLYIIKYNEESFDEW